MHYRMHLLTATLYMYLSNLEFSCAQTWWPHRGTIVRVRGRRSLCGIALYCCDRLPLIICSAVFCRIRCRCDFYCRVFSSQLLIVVIVQYITTVYKLLSLILVCRRGIRHVPDVLDWDRPSEHSRRYGSATSVWSCGWHLVCPGISWHLLPAFYKFSYLNTRNLNRIRQRLNRTLVL